MTTLIVRAGWAAHPEWTGAWMDAEPGAHGASAGMGWEGADRLPSCKELVLVVPAALLSWHRVALPRLPARRWLPALHGLLEDRLLEEPTALHLALAPGAVSGQEVTVAACNKTWLSQTLAALAQAGHRPSRIVPEFEPDGSGLHLLGQPERGWLVHCGDAQVHCLPLSHPARTCLQAWAGLHGSVPVRAEPGLAALAGDIWGGQPSLIPAGQHLQRAASSGWNLAQFDLSVRRSLSRRLSGRLHHAWTAAAWRPMRWGLAAVLAANLLGLQAWAWKQEHQLGLLQREIQAQFRAAFPQVSVVVDPVLQMERETRALAQASGQAAPGELASMLAAMARLPGSGPDRIDFRPGELSLTGWQADAASVPSVQADLAQQGYRLQSEAGRWTLRVAETGSPP